MKTVLVTGGFDPIHSGHISYFAEAKNLGDRLVVGINSDSWLERKKGRSFMAFQERKTIIKNLKMVDLVIDFDDSDGSSKKAIQRVKELFPDDQIIFANGGDRTKDNIPEMDEADTTFVFGVGGSDKINSSSLLLDEWKAPKTPRPWGYYRVLYDQAHLEGSTKVKEITVNPGQSLSLQKHQFRSEYWHVAEGMCRVHGADDGSSQTLILHENYFVPREKWHRLSNPFKYPCRIIEIQFGSNCIESDIERRPIV